MRLIRYLIVLFCASFPFSATAGNADDCSLIVFRYKLAGGSLTDRQMKEQGDRCAEALSAIMIWSAANKRWNAAFPGGVFGDVPSCEYDAKGNYLRDPPGSSPLTNKARDICLYHVAKGIVGF